LRGGADEVRTGSALGAGLCEKRRKAMRSVITPTTPIMHAEAEAAGTAVKVGRLARLVSDLGNSLAIVHHVANYALNIRSASQ
jgi:hypothetical protein